MHTRQRMPIIGKMWTTQLNGSNRNWLAVERICSSIASSALLFESSNCGGLPAVPSIKGFKSTEELCCRRRIEGASFVGIAAKLRNLKTIDREVNDDEKRDALVRQVKRFGTYLATLCFLARLL